MKKITVFRAILFTLFIFTAVCCAYAECYNEDMCFKDYVVQEDNNIVVAVNRDTNAIELYWSDKDQTWIKPDAKYQTELQGLYKRKLQQRRMQARLNQMHQDTMYNTSQGQVSRQGR